MIEQREYRRLYSSSGTGKAGPKDLSKELINAIVDMKQRNPTLGCPRIAQQIILALGTNINKDVVSRILAAHCPKDTDDKGLSWLSLLGHTKDSLWSVDLCRCESIPLKSHWVLVVMDQQTRRIIGFAAHAGAVDGASLCCMFNKIIAGKNTPQQLSSENDPLFQYCQWQANLLILEIEEIKSIPYTPT